MYESICFTFSSIIPQLGFTSIQDLSFRINGHFPKSNFKNLAVKSTRTNNPLSWDDDYLYQNSTKAFQQKEKNQRPSQEPTLMADDEDEDDVDVGVDFLLGEKKDVGKLKKDEDVLLSIKGDEKTKEVVKSRGRSMRRSNMMAKQVISVQSALTLGFVSQLWVDVTSWLLKVVEVKPNLLSGELERFLLEDIMQVGDVVLVKDESVVENEFKLVGLETLVGYNVVTPRRRKIGKVRGYSFNVDSGAVEMLELDSFGISIIPSTLVSTYALFTEDVLEVGSDTVVVHEAAASRIQRLTKGLWDTQSASNSIDEFDEYPEPRKPQSKSNSNSKLRGKRNRKLRPEMADADDDWELPMDYL